MSAKFVVEEGDSKGLVFSLEEEETQWILGTDSHQSQFVVKDAAIAPQHFLISKENEKTLLEPLESQSININDEEMTIFPYSLQQGDIIRAGGTVFRFYEETTAHIVEEKPTEENLETTTEVDFNEELPNNTLYSENEEQLPDLAEINFNLIESGRWLLKVVSGPNNGAEFYMQTGQSYAIGTDPHACDIVFHDNSVSRQHARITIQGEDHLEIEDLNSRNGTLVEGDKIEGRQKLAPGTLVTLGTTSFLVYDREGEMQTIISPLLPSIFKTLQQNEPPKEEPSPPIPTPEPLPVVEPLPPPPEPQHGSMILIAVIIGLFALAAIGTIALFREEPVTLAVQENADDLIKQAIQPYPAVKFIFNQGTGGLLLLGHVSTPTEKNQLMYELGSLKFIKSIDDSGIVIDEYVWQEMNSILSKNQWKGMSLQSPAAGQFILRGYLKTRKEAEQLSNYISLNFSYIDLLKKDIIVEEDVLNQINDLLRTQGLFNVIAKMNNGEVSLTGNVSSDKAQSLEEVLNKIKGINGVRIVNNYVQSQVSEMGRGNLSDQYEITGKSKVGDRYTVVINGKILSQGDVLDGLEIKKITADTILLEKGDKKYRIDY